MALESWLSLGANLRLLTLCPAKHPPLQTLIPDTCHSRFCCLKSHTHSHTHTQSSRPPIYGCFILALLVGIEINETFWLSQILGFQEMVSAKRHRAEAAAAAAAAEVAAATAAAAAAAAAEAAAAALSPDEKLQALQDELKKVNAETKEKISEIRRNCLEKRKAIFDRRNEIINGIPDFWMRVFSNHCMMKILVSTKDREIFGYLDSLRVEYLDLEDPRKGYSIKLKFRANPFFSNKQLKKTIKFSGEGTIRSKGTSIDWMAGKGPGEVHRIDENGIQRPFPGCSIFSWICFPEGFEIVLDQDWVANVIMEDLWTNPMQFLDPVESEDEDGEEEDYNEDEDDENDDDEEDDD